MNQDSITPNTEVELELKQEVDQITEEVSQEVNEVSDNYIEKENTVGIPSYEKEVKINQANEEPLVGRSPALSMGIQPMGMTTEMMQQMMTMMSAQQTDPNAVQNPLMAQMLQMFMAQQMTAVAQPVKEEVIEETLSAPVINVTNSVSEVLSEEDYAERMQFLSEEVKPDERIQQTNEIDLRNRFTSNPQQVKADERIQRSSEIDLRNGFPRNLEEVKPLGTTEHKIESKEEPNKINLFGENKKKMNEYVLAELTEKVRKQVLFVAMGQGGGNIVDGFASLGYKTVAVNSAIEDINALNHVTSTYHIVGGEGAQRDIEEGEYLALKSLDPIIKLIDEAADKDVTIVFFVASTGGGTGAGGTPIIAQNYIEYYNAKYEEAQENYRQQIEQAADDEIMDIEEPELKPRIYPVITIIPSQTEGYKLNDNAVKAIENLASVPGIGAIFPIDNDNVIDNNYSTLNNYAVAVINNLLNMHENSSDESINGIVDFNEIKKQLGTQGFAFIYPITSGNSNADATKQVLESVKNNPIFCQPQLVDDEGKLISPTSVAALLPNTRYVKETVYKVMGKPYDNYYTYNPNKSAFYAMFGTMISRERTKGMLNIVREGVNHLTANMVNKSKGIFGDAEVMDLSELEKAASKMGVGGVATKRTAVNLDTIKGLKPKEDPSISEVAATTAPQPRNAKSALKNKILRNKK